MGYLVFKVVFCVSISTTRFSLLYPEHFSANICPQCMSISLREETNIRLISQKNDQETFQFIYLAPSSNTYKHERREGSEGEKSPSNVVQEDALRHEEEAKSSTNNALSPSEKR